MITGPCPSCGVALWSCPECAFTFDAIHEDVDGGYSCPACAERELRTRLQALEEKAATP